jgi:hypothetical protein
MCKLENVKMWADPSDRNALGTWAPMPIGGGNDGMCPERNDHIFTFSNFHILHSSHPSHPHISNVVLLILHQVEQEFAGAEELGLYGA